MRLSIGQKAGEEHQAAGEVTALFERSRRAGPQYYGCVPPRLVLLLLLALWPAVAQELLVYPELQRPAISGDVLAADRSGRKWEIISPAAPSNGYLSFFVVVKLREPGFFRLDVVMNPADRLRADLYRVHYEKLTGNGEYYPEVLSPAGRTVIGTLPDPDVPAQRVTQQGDSSQGQARAPDGGHDRNSRQDQAAAVAAYWLDLYVPSETPAERVRVEAVLQSAGPRIVCPMEIRVLPIAFPAWNAASLLRGPAAALAPISAAGVGDDDPRARRVAEGRAAAPAERRGGHDPAEDRPQRRAGPGAARFAGRETRP